MQLRYETQVTGEEYVTRSLWREASLARCPLHPEGGCGFRRHGMYERKNPPGAKVARWYCRTGKTTFSLLPDCLASRHSAQLPEMEDVVAQAGQAPSQEKAVERLWPELGLQGALRKLRRWKQAVLAVLTIVIGLLPEVSQPTVEHFREVLGTGSVLMLLRDRLAKHLAVMAPPLGFGPRSRRGRPGRGRLQHEKGPDPPR